MLCLKNRFVTFNMNFKLRNELGERNLEYSGKSFVKSTVIAYQFSVVQFGTAFWVHSAIIFIVIQARQYAISIVSFQQVLENICNLEHLYDERKLDGSFQRRLCL